MQHRYKPHQIHPDLVHHKLQQQPAATQAHDHAHRTQQQILLEHISRSFLGMEAQHLDGGDLPDSFRNVNIGQIVQHDHSQRTGTDNDGQHHRIQCTQHGADLAGNIIGDDHIHNTALLRRKGTGFVMVAVIFQPHKGHLLARQAAPLGFHRFRLHDRIVLNTVVVNGGNFHSQLPHIRVSQCYGITNLHAQVLCHTNGKESLSGAGHTQLFPILRKVNKALQALVTGYQENLLCGTFEGDIHTGLVEEQNIGSLAVHGIPERVLLFLGLGPREINRQIIDRYIFKLIHRSISNGIAQAKAGQQQRRTATDADKHHKHPLAIAEHISQHHLVQETDVLPEGQVFQENFLAGVGCFGTDQLRRHFLQAAAAAIPGYQQHYNRVSTNHSQAQRPVDLQHDGWSDVQNNTVRIPKDHGENGAAQQNAQSAANHSGAACIEQVFTNDSTIAVAQGFQCTDLGTLFLHHAGHGSDAHQGSHQQEESREHPGNACQNVCVAVEGRIAGVGIAVQNVDFRIGHGINGLPGIRQLLGCIGKLLLGLCQFRICLSLALFILCTAFIQLGLCFFQRSEACFQFRTAGIQFLLTGRQLQCAGFNLRLGGSKLVFRLDLGTLQLQQAEIQCSQAVGQRFLGGSQFLLFSQQFFPLSSNFYLFIFQIRAGQDHFLILLAQIFQFDLGKFQIAFQLAHQQFVHDQHGIGRIQGCLQRTDLDRLQGDAHFQQGQIILDLLQAIVDLFQAIVDLLQTVLDLGQAFFHQLQIFRNGLIVFHQLGITGSKLGIRFRLAIQKLLTGIFQQCRLFIQGFLAFFQLFQRIFQSLAVGIDLCLAVFQLCQGIIQLLISLFPAGFKFL